MTADIAALTQAFVRQFGRPPELVAEAPGRVNLIGDHTDYNAGFVLPAAIDRTVAVALAPRDDEVIRAYSLDYDQCDEFQAGRVRRFAGSRGWRDYLRGVVWALCDSQYAVAGADLAIAGDVPKGAGLSSSAAIEIALAGGLMAAAGITVDRRLLALLCQRAENFFVGVQSGIMDQYASALGQAGHALLIDCRSLEAEPVPLAAGVAIVVVDSKLARRLADTPYNRRREECAEAARTLGIDSLRAATTEMLSRLSGDLLKRAHHVVSENARVLAAAQTLRTGDLDRLGALMAESHASMRDDFEASSPEIDLLVELAQRTDGVIGARVTGAGWGGCTVNLVRENTVDTFAGQVAGEYARRTGLAAEFDICRAVDGLWVSDA
ncbi:MAG TPA: galactokinase [Dehalococcoidia bacterium]